MRSFKTGVVSIAFASVVGMAAVIGCSASGGDDTVTDGDPTEPAPVATLPPGSGSSSSGDAPVTDAGKKDSGKKAEAGVDAGPPPPVAGDPCVNANEVKTKSCGICGKATTICLDDGTTKKWSDYGDCQNELAGGCAPGTTQACGNCGTATCNQFCAFTACAGQPANSCSPGDVTLLSAGCATGTYRQQTCAANCTLGNASLTCETPPTFVSVPAAIGGVASGVITFTTAAQIPRLSGTCPTSGSVDNDPTPYAYFEVRNTTGKAVTVVIYHTQMTGGPAPDTVIAAYAGATPPTSDAQRKACSVGVGDFGTVALVGNDNFASLDGTKVVSIPAGGSVTVYSANYYAPGEAFTAGDDAVGNLKLNVKTVTIAP